MFKVKITAIVEFFSGQIGLNPKQAKRRRLCLDPVLDDQDKPINGLFEVLKPVQFKAGEVIQVEDVPKALMASVEILEAPRGWVNPLDRHRKPAKGKPGPKPKEAGQEAAGEEKAPAKKKPGPKPKGKPGPKPKVKE